MLERDFQAALIKEIHELLPGCVILKNDPNYIQGVPDLTVFYGPRYAMLEVKASEKSRERPNQRYYIEQWAEVGAFSTFIYPENKEEVLIALQQSLAG